MNMPQDQDAYLSPVQVAKMLGVSQPYVWKLLNNGLLPYVQLPSSNPEASRKTPRIKKSALDEFIERHSVPARKSA